MKRLVEKLVFVAIFLGFFTTAAAQPFKKITLNDFQGAPKPAENGEEIAFTSCSIQFSYTAKKELDYYLVTFSIKLVLNKNQSWIDKTKLIDKKAIDDLLDHEQGHYDIAYLEQQELLSTAEHSIFYDDYVSAAKKMFNSIDSKYRRLNQQYDIETENSANKLAQRKWDIYFMKRLGNIQGFLKNKRIAGYGRWQNITIKSSKNLIYLTISQRHDQKEIRKINLFEAVAGFWKRKVLLKTATA